MKIGLTGNVLKLIALLTMTIDHIGAYLLPQYPVLRMIGRLAYPIYAFMIAEGCRHTRNMGRYLGSVAAVAIVCQVVNYLARGDLYMCIMVTFSLSIGLCWLLKIFLENHDVLSGLLLAAGGLTVLFLCQYLPGMLRGTGFKIDYGIYGVALPVLIYLGRTKWEKLLLMALGLLALCLENSSVQWYCLLALPLLLLYNGQRGKWKIKWLFYLYYPAHLALIYVVAWLF